jgi:metal-dependent amidase/aminoacylase/carboxypeptidase family protein
LRYSIDTSAILDAWVRGFPPDVVPGLWKQLEELIDNGQLIATEEVLYELEKKEDDAYEWAKNHENMFILTDERIQLVVIEILRNHKKLIDTRKNRSGADPFVIALAKVEGCGVVTGEKPTNRPDRPKIPDVCRAIDIPCINILQLCREQKWVFDLRASTSF